MFLIDTDVLSDLRRRARNPAVVRDARQRQRRPSHSCHGAGAWSDGCYPQRAPLRTDGRTCTGPSLKLMRGHDLGHLHRPGHAHRLHILRVQQQQLHELAGDGGAVRDDRQLARQGQPSRLPLGVPSDASDGVGVGRTVAPAVILRHPSGVYIGLESAINGNIELPDRHDFPHWNHYP